MTVDCLLFPTCSEYIKGGQPRGEAGVGGGENSQAQ